MVLTGKMQYKQTDAALTASFQAVTFSDDGGTTVLEPGGIMIENKNTTGSVNVIVSINGNSAMKDIPPKGVLNYSKGRIKSVKIKTDNAGSPPDYEISGWITGSAR
jgi:hypothetical protein